MKAMNDELYQVSIEFGIDSDKLPCVEQIRAWVCNALAGLCPAASLDLRVVDRDEMHAANRRYRRLDRPTNVLSFAADLPPEVELNHLGDILISAPIVIEEAKALGINNDDHWAHLVTHGVLHLLGYDHDEDDAALEMETVEQQILKRIGVDIGHLGHE